MYAVKPVFKGHCDERTPSDKVMLIKESVLRPEIFQILSASQAKKHTQKKTQDNIRLNSVYIDIICIVIHIYTGGRRSPAVACWASDHWVASSNPLRGKFRH